MSVSEDYLRRMSYVYMLGAREIANLEAAAEHALGRERDRLDALLAELRAARDELQTLLIRLLDAGGLQEKVSTVLAEGAAHRLNAGFQRAGEIAASLKFQKALDDAAATFRGRRPVPPQYATTRRERAKRHDKWYRATPRSAQRA